jgi:hypothetical protein
VTDNWPTLEPWFNETGDNAPSMLSPAQQKELEQLAEGTLQCLGFTVGVFHVEAKMTSRGPRLIEVNSRMGGGQVRDNNLAVWGVDLVDESLLAALGIPNAPPVPEAPLCCRSALYFNSTKTGYVGPGDWLEEVRSKPGVVYAKLLAHEGEHVVSCEEGMPTWLGQIMCNGDTPEEACALVREYETLVDCPILPQPAMPDFACLAPEPSVAIEVPEAPDLQTVHMTIPEEPAASSPTAAAAKPVAKKGGLSSAFGR